MSPKATATKRAQILANHELFAGGYYVTANKKVRPALLPVETEVTDAEGRTSRGFLATSNDRPEVVTPHIMGDLTMNFYTVISGQQPGTVADLFTKNAGRAFTLADIETAAPILYPLPCPFFEGGGGIQRGGSAGRSGQRRRGGGDTHELPAHPLPAGVYANRLRQSHVPWRHQ